MAPTRGRAHVGSTIDHLVALVVIRRLPHEIRRELLRPLYQCHGRTPSPHYRKPRRALWPTEAIPNLDLGLGLWHLQWHLARRGRHLNRQEQLVLNVEAVPEGACGGELALLRARPVCER